MSAEGETATRRRARRVDALAALLLALATVLSIAAVEKRQGIGRDEAQYFRAGERYWGWFEELGRNLAAGQIRRSFTPGDIDTYWGDNPEHPPVMKVLYGLTWRAFHRCHCPEHANLHWIPVQRHRTIPLFAWDASAFRFAAMLMAGLGAALVYLFARRFVGVAAAVAASILSVAQPHYFFHAQISCFDAPITVMAVAVGLAYWKSLRSARWGLLAGPVFGIALGVKHNAWLMPAFLVGHYLWMRRGDWRRRRLPRVPLAFVSMATLGPLVFLALWPRLWPDPVGRVRWYLLRHLQHEHYTFEYLGRNWNVPPKEWDRKLLRATFPFVSTGFTVPATTLALAAAGVVVLARRKRDEGSPDEVVQAAPPVAPAPSWLRPGADVDLAPGGFFFVQILGPMAVLAVPSTPIFGGVKHFMPAMPYLSIVAGMGLAWATKRLAALLADARLRRAAPAALATLACVPAVAETHRSHPDGLSHYNMLAGGFAGGASLGMNRQFWGYSVAPILPWLTKNVTQSRATYWHDVIGEATAMYVRDGRMPPGLGWAGVGEDAIPRSDLAMLQHERHFALYEGLIWESYGTTKPVLVRDREGVPIVTVYKRPGAP